MRIPTILLTLAAVATLSCAAQGAEQTIRKKSSHTSPPVQTAKPDAGAGATSQAAESPAVGKGEQDPVTGMEFVQVKGGCFRMGDSLGDGDRDEKPAHDVCVRDFFLGKYEVTQKEWEKVMGNNPSTFRQCGADCPVESVSWAAVQEFITRLNAASGREYRLPTEAEWEYAARGTDAVNTVPLRRRWWSVGPKDVEKKACAHANVLDRKALLALKASGLCIDSESFACETDGYVRSAPIGRFDSNRFGLYDMLGNVWEWVQDCYHETYQGRPSEGMAWMDGRDCQSDRQVVRGGSWDNGPKAVRSADRLQYIRGDRDDAVGFRLAQDLK